MDINAAWKSVGHPRLLVLGDVMLDRYTWGDAERVSPEAPVIVLNADQDEVRPGGAASVAYLLQHLGAKASIAGIIGNDSDGHVLRDVLRDEGIDVECLLTDPTRPTTVKHRFVGRASHRHPHQMLRVDRESRIPLSATISEKLWLQLENRLDSFDAVVISDYSKGVCELFPLTSLIEIARTNGLPVLVDPGRGTPCVRYRGATVLKPNRSQVQSILGTQLSSLEEALEAAAVLRKSFDIDTAVVTMDRDGLVVSSHVGGEILRSQQRAVYDITGAGDMVLAILAISMACGIGPNESATIANIAAGIEVERFGVTPITRDEIGAYLLGSVGHQPPKLVTFEELNGLIHSYRMAGKQIAFTNGCFDLLHVGHLKCLQEAATLGDVLIVGVNSDSSVRRLKGNSRPIVGERDRASMLAALDCVTHVVVFDEETPRRLISAVRPDVLVKGGTTRDVVGRDLVEAYGGTVISLQAIEGVSTTGLVQNIATASLTKG